MDPYVTGDYDVAEDGRFVMIRRRGAERPGELIVVENWFEELKAKGGERVKKLRVPEIAFIASGVSVVGSFPVSVALQKPDLPGIVLAVTGGLAAVFSFRRWRERSFQILATLALLTTAMITAHQFWHRTGVSHDWLEPLYVGAIVLYCGVAISLTRRLLSQDVSRPPA